MTHLRFRYQGHGAEKDASQEVSAIGNVGPEGVEELAGLKERVHGKSTIESLFRHRHGRDRNAERLHRTRDRLIRNKHREARERGGTGRRSTIVAKSERGGGGGGRRDCADV